VRHPYNVRRSTVVTLTLLPMIAAAAVASADDDPPQDPDVTVLAPPGMTEPSFRPPGMVPIHEPGAMQLDCSVDPDWRLRDDCIQPTSVGFYSVYRGGFGSYFWAGGG
jgi:hypothetical protein